ncbi:glycosyltransferase [Vibrio alginolyticus]|uniref:glycosyltransferase n=1 Tax=Vibrio alginolyticus TaxID=663 RepID=UPI003754CFBF
MANYKGDSKNGIDVVINNMIKYENSIDFIYSLSGNQRGNNKNLIGFFELLNLFFLNKKRVDFVVFHTIFSLKTILISCFCRIFKVNYCVFPHSSTSFKSQNKSKRLKKLFRSLFLDDLLKHSSYVNYLNLEEKENSFLINDKSLKNVNFEVVGNGVEIPNLKVRREKVISFLGRYDIHHKGIDLLLYAILKIAEIIRSSGYKFVFHGVVHSNQDFEWISKFITEHQIDDLIILKGSINNIEDKNIFLGSSMYYVLTSRYEGLPLTVLEALSNGTPVIVTHDTNMSTIVKENGLGIIVESEVDSICSGLLQALSLSGSEHFELVNNAKEYSINNLKWESIINKHYSNFKRYAE